MFGKKIHIFLLPAVKQSFIIFYYISVKSPVYLVLHIYDSDFLLFRKRITGNICLNGEKCRILLYNIGVYGKNHRFLTCHS